ncbi:MAG: hypothetical protein K6A41_09495 [Bacteroidales bacterium]|nr:hypothetical protein [Bacteroidales bacterium]
MKKHYTFETGESIDATPEELQNLRTEYEIYLQNYLELYSSMEDAEYVARGNGFCDSKYSESFLDAQIEKYRSKIREIDQWLKKD